MPDAPGNDRRTGADAPDPTIAVIDVRKSFGGREVLRGISLEVRRGESLVIVGQSGAGKSVLLKHLIGLITPDSGHVIIDGEDLTNSDPARCLEIRRKFGMSFQEGALFDSMDVFGNIAFPLRRTRKMSEDEVAARVRTCLEMVHLQGVESKATSELSGGMRRRVGFARAIAHEPRILLFDEPNTGLDPITAAVIDSVIVEMREHLDVTMVTITHDMKSAFRIADRIAMLRNGRIIADAAPDAFRDLPDPFIRKFLAGEPLEEEVA